MTSTSPLPATGAANTGIPKAPRYLSLDVLRGLTIALMVVVNNPGSWSAIYPPFKHAAWHGFTPTDLVFPAFLFVVGNAMSFSMRKFEQQADSIFLKKVFTRTLLIFICGLLLTLYPFISRSAGGELAWKDFSSVRIMGVLQRIALCYCLASLIIRYMKQQGALILSILILAGYWLVMYLFGDPATPYSLEGNASLKFDRLFIPDKNMYHGYGIPFDPEGLLSTLPGIVNVIAGYIAGKFIQKSRNTLKTVQTLIVYGLMLLVIAQIWNSWFPINKPIWTSSYVLHSTGLCLLILAILLFVIEVCQLKSWTYFFEAFGKNPLFIFIMSAVVVKTIVLIPVNDTNLRSWIYDSLFLSWLEGKNASLAYALFFMLLMWLLAWWMDKKRIYVKL